MSFPRILADWSGPQLTCRHAPSFWLSIKLRRLPTPRVAPQLLPVTKGRRQMERRLRSSRPEFVVGFHVGVATDVSNRQVAEDLFWGVFMF